MGKHTVVCVTSGRYHGRMGSVTEVHADGINGGYPGAWVNLNGQPGDQYFGLGQLTKIR